MNKLWTKNLDAEQSADVRAGFKEALRLRKRLITMLNHEMEVIRENMLAKNKFENPNWALVQADANGELRAYNRLIKLLNDEKSD